MIDLSHLTLDFFAQWMNQSDQDDSGNYSEMLTNTETHKFEVNKKRKEKESKSV